jgi:uncharacterized protein (TIGR03435 family)
VLPGDAIMKKLLLLALSVICAIVLAIPVVSKEPPGESKPSFEVASIKPSGEKVISIRALPGGRFVATYVTLRLLITIAYHVREFQIVGPNWIDSDYWDIQARAEEVTVPPPTGTINPGGTDLVALRLQSLLEERFRLRCHLETREFPVYQLIIAKGGPKLKLSDAQGPTRPPELGNSPAPKPGGPVPRGSGRIGTGYYEAHGIEFEGFVSALSRRLGRVVVDKTGLKGLYDVKLQWTPDMDPGIGPIATTTTTGIDSPTSDFSGPSIFTALQEQLGLKLESTKAPLEVLIIDSVDKPTEN